METKVCKRCGIEKNIVDFRCQVRNGKEYFSGVCKKCDYENGKPRHKKFREIHRKEIRITNKEYYAENKTEIKERQKDKKPIWDRNYYLKNKKKVQKIQQRRAKERYVNDPNFRIRKTISKAIWRHLMLNNSSKNGNSCLNFLSYEIREYLEKLFEPWMSWNNYGKYDDKSWDDNDLTTWTWQIDHIIPHSDFEYKSMEDEDFKRAWDMNNLRPLSAKQNWLDGISKSRHKKAA